VEEKIEILSVELLDEYRLQVNGLKRLARALNLEFGWHYLLDLTWILGQLGPVKGKRILDAGAGTGMMQWYLAQEGAEVISVDRLSRTALPLRFRTRFRVQGLRKQDLIPSRQVFRDNFRRQGSWSIKMKSQAREMAGLAQIPKGAGRVFIYNQDLANLSDIRDNSLDAVVAVSALEHNPPENLEKVVNELMRVLKPGGALVATLTAARDQDWWHTASSGWCYTDTSLRRIFCLPPNLPSNYDRYDELFTALVGCEELRAGLAKFYFQSGDNGMPWGKWDPQYQPVGVCKVKR
jgi:ubiquinone/menaquinone biosynthesis C-methylase UbiE